MTEGNAEGTEDSGGDLVTANYRTLLSELIACGAEAIGRPVEPPIPDCYSTMLWAFAQKTLYHARSVALLVDWDLEHDAGLIVRSMVEGLGQLIWMHEDPQTRPAMWRDFGAVEHYRWIQRRLIGGGEVREETKAELERILRACGGQFLRSKKKPVTEFFSPGSENCFRVQWLPTSEWRDHARVRGYLDWVYADLSGWMHWSVTAIQGLVKIEEEAIEFTPYRTLARTTALAIAVGVLGDVLNAVGQELRLDLPNRVDELMQKFLGRHVVEMAQRAIDPQPH